jgi:hypothetical protein
MIRPERWAQYMSDFYKVLAMWLFMQDFSYKLHTPIKIDMCIKCLNSSDKWIEHRLLSVCELRWISFVIFVFLILFSVYKVISIYGKE